MNELHVGLQYQYERAVHVSMQVQRRAQREERLLPNQLRRGYRPATKEMKWTKPQTLKQPLVIIPTSIADPPTTDFFGWRAQLILSSCNAAPFYSTALAPTIHSLSYFTTALLRYSASFCEVVFIVLNTSRLSTSKIAHIVYYDWNNY